MDAVQIEDRYGVSGAFADTIATSDGPLNGMLVPITLANGRQGHLFIPQRQAGDEQAVYLQDGRACTPCSSRRTRAATRWLVPRASSRPGRRPHGRASDRGSEKCVIIGGSAGAGTAIGAIAGRLLRPQGPTVRPRQFPGHARGWANAVTEGLTFIPKDLLKAEDFRHRGGLPHHNEISVDYEFSRKNRSHKLYGDAGAYHRRFEWRKKAATEDFRAAYPSRGA